jgi:hypothetical protein
VRRADPDIRISRVPVTIAISTGPSGISLESELKLLKPALLYADHVDLYSPVAAALESIGSVAKNKDKTFASMRELAPLLDPQAAQAFAQFDQLQTKSRLTGSDRRRIKSFRALLAQISCEMLEKVEEMYAHAGGDELSLAVKTGLVTVDPLVRAAGDDMRVLRGVITAALGRPDEDILLPAFMDRLDDLLSEGDTYPLFDDLAAGVVRERSSNDLLELSQTSRRRGKQATLAANLMEQLPAFPMASIAEVLQIRDELRKPLVRFRAAIIEMERRINAASYEPNFAAEVEELYLETVAPALNEIDEQIATNAYLRELVGAAVDQTTSLLGAGLAVGFATGLGLQPLVAAAIEVAFPAAAITTKGTWSYLQQQREASRHQLFFLYKVNASLR